MLKTFETHEHLSFLALPVITRNEIYPFAQATGFVTKSVSSPAYDTAREE